MPTDVIMPALGMAQETGKVLRWLKREGEAVSQGEPLLEIETDKATVELEAPASGVLAGVSVAEGETVPVGQVIALILAPGEAMAAAAQATASHPTLKVPAQPAPTTGLAPPQAASAGPAAAGRVPAGAPPAAAVTASRVPASPRARRLAREMGVDLAVLTGTGPGGAVQADDVLAAQAQPRVTAPVTPGTVWRLMAERTTRTWTTVPHFFLLRDVHAGRLVAWLEEHRPRFQVDVTYTDLLIRLTGVALRRHPRLNARWEDGKVIFSDAVNIGLAVANEEGLIVPVIRGADLLPVGEITRRRADLVARTRAGRLRPDDITGGTFTISNLGMYGIDAFTAVINAGQAAILAVGRIAGRVVPVEDQPVVRPMLTLSLSCDHRVVDGLRGAQFLDTLAGLIEEPVGLEG